MIGLKKPALPLFLFLLALYLCTYSADPHSSDGLAMVSTAESLVRRGAWDVEQIRWMGLQQGTFGLDGLLYSRKGLGQPLLALPLAWLGLLLPGLGLLTTTMLFNSLITAFTGVLVLWFVEKLGYSSKIGVWAGLIYGAGTMAWPYAKTFFSDTLAGTLLLMAALALFLYRQNGQTRWPFVAGLSLAWAVATRYAEVVFLPVFGLLLLAYLWQRVSAAGTKLTLRSLLIYPAIWAFGAPIAVVGLALLGFNFSRYGNPLNTGYLPEESFSAVWWQGLAGQLISPGRGLLLYNPILLVTCWGVKPFFNRHRLEAIGLAAIVLIHWLLYGKWFMWHGGFAWGARFMVATLPAWAILMAPALEAASKAKTQTPKILLGLLGAITLFLQIPALSVDFDLWQNRLVDTGLPLFAPITFFDPAYSPLGQTWQFIRPENLDVAWAAGGKIGWGVLALLVVNLLVAGLNLRRAFHPAGKNAPALAILAPLAAGLTLIGLLSYAHQTWPADLKQALAEVNRLPSAGLIYHDPQKAQPIADLYAGRGPELGLLALEQNRLDVIRTQAGAVWFLPTFHTDIEAYLLQRMGVAQNRQFGEQRLILLAQPDGPVEPVTVTLGEQISLQTAQLSAALRPNAPFAVTLSWQALIQPAADYQIFIHLLNAAGEVATQTDGAPANGVRPTGAWQAGETVIDPHALWVAELAPGTYTVIAGLYQPATGQRLVAANGADFVRLGEFTVR